MKRIEFTKCNIKCKKCKAMSRAITAFELEHGILDKRYEGVDLDTLWGRGIIDRYRFLLEGR